MRTLCSAMRLALVHVRRLSADKGFVNFDRASIVSAELEANRLFLRTNLKPMQHEPSGLLRDTKRAMQFVRGNPVLIVDQHP